MRNQKNMHLKNSSKSILLGFFIANSLSYLLADEKIKEKEYFFIPYKTEVAAGIAITWKTVINGIDYTTTINNNDQQTYAGKTINNDAKESINNHYYAKRGLKSTPVVLIGGCEAIQYLKTGYHNMRAHNFSDAASNLTIGTGITLCTYQALNGGNVDPLSKYAGIPFTAFACGKRFEQAYNAWQNKENAQAIMHTFLGICLGGLTILPIIFSANPTK